MFVHPVLKCMNVPSTVNILLYQKFWDKKEAGLINNFSLKYFHSYLSKRNQPLLLLWSTKSYLVDKKAHSSAARCYRSPSVSRTNVRFVPLKKELRGCVFVSWDTEGRKTGNMKWFQWGFKSGHKNPSKQWDFVFIFFKYSKTKVTGV